MQQQLTFCRDPYGSGVDEPRAGCFVSGTWQTDTTRLVQDSGVTALFFNSSRGWKGRDFSFLRELECIEEVDILQSEATGLEVLESLPKLTKLRLSCNVDGDVNLSALASLRDCSIVWARGLSSVVHSRSIECLSIEEYKPKLLDVSEMPSLRELSIRKSACRVIHLGPQAGKLAKLELIKCSKLESYEFLSTTSALKWLAIEGAKNFKGVRQLVGCRQLEYLNLTDCGEISGLDGIEKLVGLKSFAFGGSTFIADGDLSRLVQLPQLSMLMFQPRDHYSHKLVKEWNWGNLDIPDPRMLVPR